MLKDIQLKFGRYLFFKKINSCSSFNEVVDNNIEIVTDFNRIKYNNFGIKKNVIERVLCNNDELFVCFDSDVPLGMMCGHRGSCYVKGPGISIIQNNNTIYWFWAFTSPEHRRKNVFKRLKNFFYNHYSDAEAFGLLVDPSNVIMIREMSIDNFIELKKYYYIKFGLLSFVLEICTATERKKVSISYGNKYNFPEI